MHTYAFLKCVKARRCATTLVRDGRRESAEQGIVVGMHPLLYTINVCASALKTLAERLHGATFGGKRGEDRVALCG